MFPSLQQTSVKYIELGALSRLVFTGLTHSLRSFFSAVTFWPTGSENSKFSLIARSSYFYPLWLRHSETKKEIRVEAQGNLTCYSISLFPLAMKQRSERTRGICFQVYRVFGPLTRDNVFFSSDSCSITVICALQHMVKLKA